MLKAEPSLHTFVVLIKRLGHCRRRLEERLLVLHEAVDDLGGDVVAVLLVPGDEPGGVVQLVHDPGPGHHGLEHGEAEQEAGAHAPHLGLAPPLVPVEMTLVQKPPAVMELGLVRTHALGQQTCPENLLSRFM